MAKMFFYFPFDTFRFKKLSELLDVSRTGVESFHVAHKAVVAVWESLG
jgi:hypothetical protein